MKREFGISVHVSLLLSISEREIINNEETEFNARNPHPEIRNQQGVVLLTTHCTSNMI